MSNTTATPEQAYEYFSNKLAFTSGPVEVSHMIEQREPINIIDVRAAKDFATGHVPGAVNLPQEEWALTNALDKDRLNILYCYSHVCHLAAKAAVEFSKRGYRVMEMDGGFKDWTAHKLPVEASRNKDAREPPRGSVTMKKDDPERMLH